MQIQAVSPQARQNTQNKQSTPNFKGLTTAYAKGLKECQELHSNFIRGSHSLNTPKFEIAHHFAPDGTPAVTAALFFDNFGKPSPNEDLFLYSLESNKASQIEHIDFDAPSYSGSARKKPSDDPWVKSFVDGVMDSVKALSPKK